MTRSLVVVTLLASCTMREPLGLPVDQQSLPVSLASREKTDLLFMIDNSPSMAAMQTQLLARFPALLERFLATLPVGRGDLHIGVVTSDYGAGNTTNASCEASPGGQHGLLQAIGVAAAPGCTGPVGVPYIQYAIGAGGATKHNLPPGQNLAQTFTCMASVGVQGCGFEHQLESVYAALKNSIAGQENKGFLRDDALLVVVFLTNEDDGSAPPTTDIFDPAKTADYGAYDTYRQTRFGVACGAPLALTPYDQSKPLTDCQAAPNNASMMIGREFDVSRYIAFFTWPASQGGVKTNPDDVTLVGIDAPEAPFQIAIIQSGSGTGTGTNPSYVPCSPAIANPPTCLVRLDHSCQNHQQPMFFGDPAVRLNTVLRAAAHSRVDSICGSSLDAPPDFTTPMQSVGELMGRQLAGGCLGAALVTPDAPSCGVTLARAGIVTPIPSCSTGAPPCWQVVADHDCPVHVDPNHLSQQMRLVIQGLPDGATPHATCLSYRL